MRELRQNWLDIFSAFRIAIDPKKMLFGFVGGLVSLAILFLLLYAFSSANAFTHGVSSLSGFLQDPVHKHAEFRGTLKEHLAPGKLMWKERGFLLAIGVLMLLVWSYIGGTILRSAAVEFSKDDRIDLREASQFAWKKFSSFFWAPLVPCIGIVFLLLCIWIFGVFGRIPGLGPVADGIFLFLPLLAGFLIVLIAIGTAFGSSLMGPTIAMEGTDAFDAISRSFAYIYGRPWRFIWYNLAGCAYAIVCTAFVAVFASAVVCIVMGATSNGMGSVWDNIQKVMATNQRDPQISLVEYFCGVLFKAWIIATMGLVAGFFISMKLTLDTIIYSLLRKDVDGTDMSEVFIEEEEEESLTPPEEKTSTPPSTEGGGV